MSRKKYPKEIYYDGRDLFFGPGRDGLADLAEEAYDIGFSNGHAASFSMDGFSSLSMAYGEGVMIDWEKLEGRTVRAVSSGLNGFFECRLHRNDAYSIDGIRGWLPGKSKFPTHVFIDAIMRLNCMELFIEGEIPIMRQTARELPAGTFFIGSHLGCNPCRWVRYDRKLPGGVIERRAAKLGSYSTIDVGNIVVNTTLPDGVIPEEC